MLDVGIYIHYPWCRKLCPYCDFPVAVAPRRGIPHGEYAAAVVRELRERAADFRDRQLVSIYFGGGTPSLWDTECVAQIIGEAMALFPARRRELEITLEANPIDCLAGRLERLRRAGINRLSIGVQSFEAAKLRALGRDHGVGDAERAVAAAAACDFSALSLDVMAGMPGPWAEPVESSVAAAARTGADHLSIYELTIADQTAFAKAARAGTLIPLSDDILATKYLAAHRTLTELGYEHYEISSFARPGKRAVHNSLYWRGGEYLGVGAGAASFRLGADGSGERRTNVRSPGRYLRAAGSDRAAQCHLLTPREVIEDRLWLGLRTADGVEEELFAGHLEPLGQLLGHGLAVARKGRILPTLRGFLFADQVARVIVGGQRYTL